MEKAGAFENLKVVPEKARRRVEPVVTEDKNVYRVEGFSCANCAGKFEKNVKQIAGVQDAKVNFGASKIEDRKSTRLNSSHVASSYAVFCLKKKKTNNYIV